MRRLAADGFTGARATLALGGRPAPRGPGHRAHRALRRRRRRRSWPPASSPNTSRPTATRTRAASSWSSCAWSAAACASAARLQAPCHRGSRRRADRAFARHPFHPRRRRNGYQDRHARRPLLHSAPRTPGHRGIRLHDVVPPDATVHRDAIGNIVLDLEHVHLPTPTPPCNRQRQRNEDRSDHVRGHQERARTRSPTTWPTRWCASRAPRSSRT